jgi:hypothetical protein
MSSRFSSVVDECEVCTALTTTSPCDTCTGWGNQDIAMCNYCGTTLHAGWGKLLLLKPIRIHDRFTAERYVWICKKARACMGQI